MQRHFRLINGLALLAMLWLAGLPTLSQALASATGQAVWVEVCTPQGLRLQALDVASSDSGEVPSEPAPAAAHPGHCPLCSLAGGALAPPPAGSLPVPASAGEAFVWRDLPPPVAEAAWRGVQPRAPPVLA